MKSNVESTISLLSITRRTPGLVPCEALRWQEMQGEVLAFKAFTTDLRDQISVQIKCSYG